MGQLAVIGWANVHIGMAGGKFAKVSHPGLVCTQRVWAGQASWQGKVIWNRQVVLVRGERVTELKKWDMGMISINWIRG